MGSDLGKAYVQIVPSAEGISGAIGNVLSGEAESAGTSAGKSIASAIKKAIVTAGIGNAIKSAVSEGAALEQSIGGIETLYKEASGRMIKYADEAYKTAGLSANAYMETATGFAAALVSSLGGDVKKASEAANEAIIDMADNSNKMGTAMENIQNAYQGFAKQNYTMLDNLKLGYGGTKEEMQRLLADAEAISGIKYELGNLGDMYAAIHIIQQELGITGTTAKEAATTISGSFASMQAAYKNLIGNMTMGRDISEPLKALVETTGTFLKTNLLPALKNILSALPEIAGELIAQLPGVISNIITVGLPQLTAGGITMLNTIRDGFAANLPTLIAEALPMILSFAENIKENASMLIDAGIDLILQIVNGLVESLPILIEYVPQIITAICDVINDNMPKILAAAILIAITLVKGLIESLPTIIANMDNIVKAIVSVISAINWINVGASIIKGLVSGVKNFALAPVNAIKGIGRTIVNTFKNGFSWKSLGTGIIDGIKSGLTSGVTAITSAAKNVASSALSAAKNFLGIHSPSRVFKDEVGKMLDLGMAEGILVNADPIKNALNEISDISVQTANKSITTDMRNNSVATNSADTENALISKMNQILGMYENKTNIGPIVIPVYIGQDKIDQKITEAINIANYRSGGR